MLRELAGICAAAAVLGIARSEYEKKHFAVERFTIHSEKLERPEQTLVFLSDLHNNEFGRRNEKLVQAIDRLHPTAVLIGGDMMVCKGKTGVEVPLALIRQLAERYPVYYGNGNHETRMKAEPEIYGDQYDRYMRELGSMGVILLQNGSAMLGKDIKITGIDLEEEYYKKFKCRQLSAEDILKKAGEASKERFQILLAHSPMFYEEYGRWGADLSLAGHFHGGTIRLPFMGGVMTPQFQFFYPWCSGMFEQKKKYMIVSRGLGTHSINIRLNNRPQLVAVTLKKAD